MLTASSVFLGVAAYVILGSWVNHNRFGVTGFDAVPHSESLRDIPYLLKDIVRRFQNGGSRGGYSAV
jgi:autophagy-related protein 27